MSRGDLLHPNCKCQIAFYFPGETKFNYPKYSKEELQEQYDIRQKTNSLTLKKEKIREDIRIPLILERIRLKARTWCQGLPSVFLCFFHQGKDQSRSTP